MVLKLVSRWQRFEEAAFIFVVIFRFVFTTLVLGSFFTLSFAEERVGPSLWDSFNLSHISKQLKLAKQHENAKKHEQKAEQRV